MQYIIRHNNDVGICPKCFHQMYLVNAVTTLSKLARSGYITTNLGQKRGTYIVCKECGYNQQMKVTIDGLIPIDQEETTHLEVPNSIGRVEE